MVSLSSRMVTSSSSQINRRGLASLWAMAVLSVIGFFLLAIMAYLLSDYKLVRQRQYQNQAHWLARAGMDYAINRLLVRPEETKIEMPSLLERSSVKIGVTPVASQKGVMDVRIEAKFPADMKEGFAEILERRIRIVTENGKTGAKIVQKDPEKSGKDKPDMPQPPSK